MMRFCSSLVAAVCLLLAATSDSVLAQPTKTIAELAAETPALSTLYAAVGAANLAGALSDNASPVTVFAPTNDAFAALPAGTVDSLLNDIPTLTSILTYHVVAGTVPASEVVGMSMAETLNSAKISIKVMNGAVYLNDKVKVTTTDIFATNGVVHLIDAVLMPPTDANASTDMETDTDMDTEMDTDDDADSMGELSPASSVSATASVVAALVAAVMMVIA
jgi:uncharacterized surface protein with fasciclin (FAS1) repeats